MTVFEPTTPHRDRLARAVMYRTGSDPDQARALANALISDEAVADPEYVAHLAKMVTRVKAVEGQLRKRIVHDICAAFDEEIEWQQQTCKDDPSDDSAFGYLQGLKASRSSAARVVREGGAT